jgi:hypothetical protein
MRIAVDALTAQSKEFPDQNICLAEVGWPLALKKYVILAMLRLTA